MFEKRPRQEQNWSETDPPVLQNGRANSQRKMHLEYVGDGTAKPNRCDRENEQKSSKEIGYPGDWSDNSKPEKNTAFRGRIIQQ
jgi:hypothetical protein